jgi:hypothetical protein
VCPAPTRFVKVALPQVRPYLGANVTAGRYSDGLFSNRHAQRAPDPRFLLWRRDDAPARARLCFRIGSQVPSLGYPHNSQLIFALLPAEKLFIRHAHVECGEVGTVDVHSNDALDFRLGLRGGAEMADYYSLIAKAVGALDLNTEKARRRLYERARTALRSRMHGAYPPFHRSEIAAAELSLEMAIEAVEAEAVVEQNAKSATFAKSQAADRNDVAHRSPARLWTGIFRRASDDAQISGEAPSGHSGDGTLCDKTRDTWLTALLARASRGVNNSEQDFAPRWSPTQSGGAN